MRHGDDKAFVWIALLGLIAYIYLVSKMFDS